MQRLDRARWATSVFFLVNGLVVGSWVPFIPEQAHALALSTGRLGVVLLGGGLGAVLAMPLAGSLVPKLGSKLVSTVGGAGFAAMFLLAVYAPAAWALMAALVLFGLCGAAMDVAMNAQAVLVEGRSGRRILSSLHGVYSLGNVVGSFGVSAAFERHVPPKLVAAFIAFTLIAAVLVSGRHMFADDRVAGTHERNRRNFAPRLIALGALVVAAMICEGGAADWSGLYLRRVRALGPGWAGVGFGVFATLMLLGRLSGDHIVKRTGEVWTLRLGGAIGALGAVLIVLGPGTWGSLLGFALLGCGLANASPVLYRAAGQVPGVPAGVGLATTVGMGYAGLLAGPPSLGGLAEAFGLPSVFLAMAGLCALLSVASPMARAAADPS